ncbi:hypothetical protein FRB99_001883 [Tulasnella sp. 403]|nr:hypothetical protein FRB99_001883 [Tulasnella sp. 403]
MDATSLDLCLSCGSHVADGTPYCSLRCQSMDHAPLRNLNLFSPSASSSRHRPSPPTHYNQYYPSPSSSRRRPLLDLQEQYYPSSPIDESEHDTHVRKLASIAEWAKGVWGSSGDFGEDDDMDSPRGSTSSSPSSSRSSSGYPSKSSPHTPTPAKSKRHSSRPSLSYNPPRFTLTAAHLAPPAMSITTSHTATTGSSPSVAEDDLYSVLTPSSSASHSSPKLSKPTKHLTDPIDPWISSPPYEFAYCHFGHTSAPKAIHPIPERGRTLLRV